MSVTAESTPAELLAYIEKQHSRLSGLGNRISVLANDRSDLRKKCVDQQHHIDVLVADRFELIELLHNIEIELLKRGIPLPKGGHNE